MQRKVKFSLPAHVTFAPIYRVKDGLAVGTIFRGRIYSNEPAYMIWKDGKQIAKAETFGEMRRLVHGLAWD